MKKITYIVLGLSFVALFSCQKEDLITTVPETVNEPEWKKVVVSDTNGPSSQGAATVDITSNNSGNGDVNFGDWNITDPNNDPDVARKKGKK